jgi:hypothetical protein
MNSKEKAEKTVSECEITVKSRAQQNQKTVYQLFAIKAHKRCVENKLAETYLLVVDVFLNQPSIFVRRWWPKVLFLLRRILGVCKKRVNKWDKRSAERRWLSIGAMK